MGRVRSYSREQLVSAAKYRTLGLVTERVSMPYEIGSFLMDQLTFQPESFEACMDLVSRFDQRDLQKVMSAICKGAIEKDKKVLSDSASKLNEVFELVWQDAAKVASRVKLAKFLIPVSIGAVGVVLNQSVGLLGGLGFAIAERVSSVTEQSISERIVRSISPGYAFTLYDFRKRYGVVDKRPLN